MKKSIYFAVMAFVAAVMISCDNNENFDCCTLKVTEHTIFVRCEYAPTKNDNGYMLFLAYTDQIDDLARMEMVELYKENGGIKESKSFTCEDLISNTKYYILAVTFSEKNGKVEIASIESLAQATLADNDSRVTVNDATVDSATVNIVLDDSGYEVGDFEVYKNENLIISAKVTFSVSDTAAQSAEDDNCYNSDEDKMVCELSYSNIKVNETITYTFYGCKMNADNATYTKYKAEIAVRKSSYIPWGFEDPSLWPPL